jgi:hypothetical protein
MMGRLDLGQGELDICICGHTLCSVLTGIGRFGMSFADVLMDSGIRDGKGEGELPNARR